MSGNTERRILIGMITQTRFLARLLPFWEKEPLRSRWSNFIADWCLSHYRKYNEAPGRAVATYYEEWQRRSGEQELASVMSRFLASLSEEFDGGEQPVNFDALLDETESFLTEVQLERVFQQGTQLLRVGDVKGAATLAAGAVPVKLRPPETIDVLRDTKAQQEAIEQQAKVLVRYKGGLGAFYDQTLCENAFLLYYGYPKGTKSFMMLDNAWTAMLQRVPVAYFQIGDMTKDQIMLRFVERALRRPITPRLIRWPKTLIVGNNYETRVEWETIQFTQPITPPNLKGFQRYLPKDASKKLLELRHYPTGTVSILDLESDLALWKQQGFLPKVVIIDYLENLAPVDRRADPVRQVSDTYARARALSEKGYLLISASQTNKEGFKANVLTRSNFRGSLMSLAQPTDIIGINQNDTEKDSQIARLNFMAKRRGFFRESKCCVIAACLDVAQPCVLSWFQ